MSFISKVAVFPRLAAIALAVVCLGALGAQSPPENASAPDEGHAAQSQGNGRPFVAGKLLVKFHSEVTHPAADALLKNFGANCTSDIEQIGVHVIQLPANANEAALAEALQQRPEVQFAELDHLYELNAIPNDPLYSQEWYMPRISAPNAWNYETGNSSIVIAVIDAGVDADHPDLAAKLVAGANFINPCSPAWTPACTNDLVNHGTGVAAIAAASTNNSKGVAGVCWNCRIMPIVAANESFQSSSGVIAQALVFAADNGARVAAVGFSATNSSTVTMGTDYFQANAKGIVTMPAGNFGLYSSFADSPTAIVVSATDPSDNIYTWSNWGTNIDLAAPGCNTTATYAGSYANLCGTSFAAPVVAGTAGLVLSRNPNLTGNQLRDLLFKAVDDRGSSGKDTKFGWGRINAQKAIELAGGSSSGGSGDTQNPTVSMTSPANGATVSGTTTVAANASDSGSGVNRVEFRVGSSLICSDSTAPYSCAWNTTSTSNGSKTLSATAVDNAGNSASNSRTVTVSNGTSGGGGDTTRPNVAITSPPNGSQISGSGRFTVQAAATDNLGVKSVTFAADGDVCTDTAAPYSCELRVSRGRHTVTATARDAAGNSAVASITVTR